MPLQPRVLIHARTEEEFRALDYRVMGKAFEIHNDLGPHLDEVVYKNELAFRLAQDGISGIREFPVDLIFSTFLKTVFIDLLVDGSTVYEIKTANSFATAHRSQAINYLFATGTKHGKLVNFRGPKVEGEFVSTTLDHDARCSFEVLDIDWQGDDPESNTWRSILVSLIRDWGAFLTLGWYREALMHLLGGLSRTETRIDLSLQGRPIGSQAVRLLTPDTMWTSTATKNYVLMKQHLVRFMEVTCLARIQWANLHNHRLQFRTFVR